MTNMLYKEQLEKIQEGLNNVRMTAVIDPSFNGYESYLAKLNKALNLIVELKLFAARHQL